MRLQINTDRKQMDKQTDNREETAQTISKIAETKQMNSQYMQENRENRRKGGRQAGR